MESRHCFLAHSRHDNFNLVTVSTAHVMQCAMGSWINLRWSALLFVYDSLVPRAILSPLS